MKIGNRSIGPNEPPLIIAEIGINHGGSLDIAKGLVDLIVHSGCECVKHQTHIIEDEMTEEAKAIFPPNANKSIWDVMKECSLNLDEEQELKEYAENLGLIWISTPFSRMAADFLDEIDVPAFKIGSGEADNLPLINHIAQKGKPIIMSTGMQSIKSLKNSVNILEKSGVEYALLECTNLYPSPPEIVSLQGIQELKEAFPKALVGFSDHSIGPHIALASVALGACIIERHFTDTRYRSGPDITCSMDPAELRLLVDRSIEIHKALMNPKQRTEPEESVYKFARASVVADRDMAAGHIITEKDIWVRRPGSGEIPGYKYNDIIGKKLRLDIKKNHQFKWSNFH
ncbi:MAG: polyhydroxyalkanoate biosynthesis repressor PhaR [Rhodobacterales bacterium]|nr:polyhydroxyalkanoate biosynthesis repressor PhaR [Rhodobacterales bacterium]